MKINQTFHIAPTTAKRLELKIDLAWTLLYTATEDSH